MSQPEEVIENPHARREIPRPQFPVTVVFACEPVWADSLEELNERLRERGYQLVPLASASSAPS